ncbi:MAG: hypothetical protein WCJ49_05780 [Deltaproteobacteria bacterium]
MQSGYVREIFQVETSEALNRRKKQLDYLAKLANSQATFDFVANANTKSRNNKAKQLLNTKRIKYGEEKQYR